MKSIIEIKHLNKSYGKYPVLKNVNLELDKGKIIGLCGPNGSGKTTLIKTIVGLLRDYDGEIFVGGHRIGPESKALISYLPDLNYFSKEMTPLQASVLYEDMYSDFNKETYLELLDKMKLNPKQRMKKMSKGMKEKLQLSLCLSREAEIYLLDEPIAGVDPASRDLIIETILAVYSKDALMVLSTHLIQDIESMLDEVIFIKEGEIYLHENCDYLRDTHEKSVDALFREVFRWS